MRVTNASVIGRIWVDMADFQADVLAAALENDDGPVSEETIRAAARGRWPPPISTPWRDGGRRPPR